MFEEAKRQITMADSDHKELTDYINQHRNKLLVQPGMAELIRDIENAAVVSSEDFPWDTIRLHSKVIIRDKMARINYTYTLVMPDESDHRKCRVSVFTPIGMSMLGQKRGNDIIWNIPGRKRYLTVMAVSQHKIEERTA